MDNKYINNKTKLDEHEIDFIKVISSLWNDRLIIVSIVFIVTLISAIYSITLPNKYQSSAILSPANVLESSNNTSSRYSGLANLAGLNTFNQNSSNRNILKANEKMNSLSFFKESILPNIYLPDLMAINSWDKKNNIIIYDTNIYDQVTKSWKTNKPTAQESFKVFKNNLEVSQDPSTGFFRISIRHHSPFIAKIWLEVLVDELNNYYRLKDKNIAQASMDYLNRQIEQTKYTEIKEAIAELLKQKTQTLTLIEVTDNYIFDYIDPPAVMEKESEPNRLFIVLTGIIIGLMLGLFKTLFQIYFKEISK